MPDSISLDELQNSQYEVAPQLVAEIKASLTTIFNSYDPTIDSPQLAIPLGNHPEELDHYAEFITHLVLIYRFLKRHKIKVDSDFSEDDVLRSWEKITIVEGELQVSTVSFVKPIVVELYCKFLKKGNRLDDNQATFFDELCNLTLMKNGLFDAMLLIRTNIDICESVTQYVENGFFHLQLLRIASKIDQLEGTDIFANAMGTVYNLLLNRKNHIILDDKEN